MATPYLGGWNETRRRGSSVLAVGSATRPVAGRIDCSVCPRYVSGWRQVGAVSNFGLSRRRPATHRPPGECSPVLLRDPDFLEPHFTHTLQRPTDSIRASSPVALNGFAPTCRFNVPSATSAPDWFSKQVPPQSSNTAVKMADAEAAERAAKAARARAKLKKHQAQKKAAAEAEAEAAQTTSDKDADNADSPAPAASNGAAAEEESAESAVSPEEKAGSSSHQNAELKRLKARSNPSQSN